MKHNLRAFELNLISADDCNAFYVFKSPVDGRKLHVLVSKENNIIAITRDKRSPQLYEINWIVERLFNEDESFTLLSYRKDRT